MLPNFLFISILSSFILTHSHSQCIDYQKNLLLQLKNELIFNSPLSSKLSQWNQTDNCCKWQGVGCDVSGNVVTLQLNNESISGGVNDSSSLFKLEHLHKLNLAYNDFKRAPISKGIRSLTNLTHLNLSYAAFGGQVAAEILSLKRLGSLDISNDYRGNARYHTLLLNMNPLKLDHPNLEMLVGNLTGLPELYLDGVNVTSSHERKEWSRVISSFLPNITGLSLCRCSLFGPLFKSFWKLRSLSVLRLDLNDLSRVVPDMFASFDIRYSKFGKS
ncbi:hypothetical protein SASPL_139124 [Salvia splendens]|uniref:Leucine-rich repeat-containing N-terminal plant-type domain-containing protein n=1 Tax=Salvia splendens TaxID=180675 RepID=A0A8X8WW08_SALSN|nr:hypothetical protein SASPL_139124 [Salvia splendens]